MSTAKRTIAATASSSATSAATNAASPPGRLTRRDGRVPGVVDGVGDDDARALAREQQRRRAAHAVARAGDERDLAVQSGPSPYAAADRARPAPSLEPRADSARDLAVVQADAGNTLDAVLPPRIAFRAASRRASSLLFVALVAHHGRGTLGAFGATRAAGGPASRRCGGAAVTAADVECARLTVPLDDTNPADTRTIDLALDRVPRTRSRAADRLARREPRRPGCARAPTSRAEIAGEPARRDPGPLRHRRLRPAGDGAERGRRLHRRLDALLRARLRSRHRRASDRARRRATARWSTSCVASRRRSASRSCRPTAPRATWTGSGPRSATSSLTYLGYSYGTLPRRAVRRAVPRSRARARARRRGRSRARRADSAGRSRPWGSSGRSTSSSRIARSRPSCAFHGGDDPADGVRRAPRPRRQATRSRPADGRTLNGTLFDIGVAQLLYDGESSWPELADALAAAERRRRQRPRRRTPTSTPGAASDGTYDDLAGVVPRDRVRRRTAGRRARRDARDRGGGRAGRAAARAVGREQLARLRVLAGRRAAGHGRSHAPGAPPILVIGTRNDPATPLSWAQRLARELGSGVLLIASRRAAHRVRVGERVRRRRRAALLRRPATAEERQALLTPTQGRRKARASSTPSTASTTAVMSKIQEPNEPLDGMPASSENTHTAMITKPIEVGDREALRHDRVAAGVARRRATRSTRDRARAAPRSWA